MLASCIGACHLFNATKACHRDADCAASERCSAFGVCASGEGEGASGEGEGAAGEGEGAEGEGAVGEGEGEGATPSFPADAPAHIAGFTLSSAATDFIMSCEAFGFDTETTAPGDYDTNC